MAVPENNASKIEQILLDLLSNSMFGADRTINCDSAKWPLVWREAYMQAVSLLAFSGEAPENCNEQLLQKIREKLKDNVRSVIHVNKQHIRLHNILTKADIPYVILKGAASAAYYKDPLLRAMGDVDFLVDEADVERACKALEENGLTKNPKEHEKHIVYYDDDGNFEMHLVPAGVPKGAQGDKVKGLLKDILSESRMYSTDFGAISLPSHFHHGLVILLHTCCHLTNEGIGLRQLCDWAAFVSTFSDKEFCEMFEEKLKSVGLWRFAQVLTTVCVECLGLPARSFTGDYEKETINDFIAEIFRSGNLGQKNATSVQESVLVRSDNEKSFLGNFISSINEIVYFYWGFTKKLKFLLPVGWLFFGGRYIVRSLMGKRPKINAKELKDRTSVRNSLYDEIKLFEE